MTRLTVRRIAAGMLAVLLLAAGPPARADEPTLYERVARGMLVIHGRCKLGGRRASIEIIERLRGSYPATQLWVSYRSDNYNRAPGTPRIEFTPGQESVFVLEPETDEAERPRGPDRFILAGGARGKIDLPPEGGLAILDAVRRITAIQALPDQEAIWSAHRSLLREANPLLVRVGFEEVLKFRLGNEPLVAPLLGHLGGPRPEFRVLALKVIGQIFGVGRRTGIAVPSADLLLRETLSRATGDEAFEVRAEAVRALRETHRPDLKEALARLASKDPSQAVRYEAEVGLMELRSQTPDPTPSPPRSR